MNHIQSVIVEVEHCIDCPFHSWCSRHDEAKYAQHFQKLKARALQYFPSLKVNRNIVPSRLRKIPSHSIPGQNKYYDPEADKLVQFPRLGSFEVYIDGMLIFSKLKANLWPNIDKVTYLLECIIKEKQNGGDMKKYSLDYRLDHEQDEHFIDTYKHVLANKQPNVVIRNKSQFQAKSQVSDTPAKRNFVSRKMHTSVKKRRQEPQELVRSRNLDVYYSRDVQRPRSKRGKTSKGERANKAHHFYDYEDQGLVFKNQFDDQKADNFVIQDWKNENSGSPKLYSHKIHRANKKLAINRNIMGFEPVTNAHQKKETLPKKNSNRLVIKRDVQKAEQQKNINSVAQKANFKRGSSKKKLNIQQERQPFAKRQTILENLPVKQAWKEEKDSSSIKKQVLQQNNVQERQSNGIALSKKPLKQQSRPIDQYFDEFEQQKSEKKFQNQRQANSISSSKKGRTFSKQSSVKQSENFARKQQNPQFIAQTEQQIEQLPFSNKQIVQNKVKDTSQKLLVVRRQTQEIKQQVEQNNEKWQQFVIEEQNGDRAAFTQTFKMQKEDGFINNPNQEKNNLKQSIKLDKQKGSSEQIGQEEGKQQGAKQVQKIQQKQGSVKERISETNQKKDQNQYAQEFQDLKYLNENQEPKEISNKSIDVKHQQIEKQEQNQHQRNAQISDIPLIQKTQQKQSVDQKSKILIQKVDELHKNEQKSIQQNVLNQSKNQLKVKQEEQIYQEYFQYEKQEQVKIDSTDAKLKGQIQEIGYSIKEVEMNNSLQNDLKKNQSAKQLLEEQGKLHQELEGAKQVVQNEESAKQKAQSIKFQNQQIEEIQNNQGNQSAKSISQQRLKIVGEGKIQVVHCQKTQKNDKEQSMVQENVQQIQYQQISQNKQVKNFEPKEVIEAPKIMQKDNEIFQENRKPSVKDLHSGQQDAVRQLNYQNNENKISTQGNNEKKNQQFRQSDIQGIQFNQNQQQQTKIAVDENLELMYEKVAEHEQKVKQQKLIQDIQDVEKGQKQHDHPGNQSIKQIEKEKTDLINIQEKSIAEKQSEKIELQEQGQKKQIKKVNTQSEEVQKQKQIFSAQQQQKESFISNQQQEKKSFQSETRIIVQDNMQQVYGNIKQEIQKEQIKDLKSQQKQKDSKQARQVQIKQHQQNKQIEVKNIDELQQNLYQDQFQANQEAQIIKQQQQVKIVNVIEQKTDSEAKNQQNLIQNKQLQQNKSEKSVQLQQIKQTKNQQININDLQNQQLEIIQQERQEKLVRPFSSKRRGTQISDHNRNQMYWTADFQAGQFNIKQSSKVQSKIGDTLQFSVDEKFAGDENQPNSQKFQSAKDNIAQLGQKIQGEVEICHRQEQFIIEKQNEQEKQALQDKIQSNQFDSKEKESQIKLPQNEQMLNQKMGNDQNAISEKTMKQIASNQVRKIEQNIKNNQMIEVGGMQSNVIIESDTNKADTVVVQTEKEEQQQLKQAEVLQEQNNQSFKQEEEQKKNETENSIKDISQQQKLVDFSKRNQNNQVSKIGQKEACDSQKVEQPQKLREDSQQKLSQKKFIEALNIQKKEEIFVKNEGQQINSDDIPIYWGAQFKEKTFQINLAEQIRSLSKVASQDKLDRKLRSPDDPQLKSESPQKNQAGKVHQRSNFEQQFEKQERSKANE